MSMSVCLVTRNEEHNIERVLRSVAGVAGEVIVVDTGSSDRTAEVAAGLGAKVCQFVWQDDFSAARNFAIGMANDDWILWLNPDEELLPQGLDKLPTYLGADNVLGYAMRVEDVLNAARPDHVSQTAQNRLFRRSEGIRFRGRLHPDFNPPLEELARSQGKSVQTAQIVVRRHAYLSTSTPDKLRWALHLLELELRDHPKQIHYMVEYGRTLLLLNDPQGHAVLAEAAQQVLAVREAPAPPDAAVGPLLEYLLTVSPEQSRSRISRDEARELALRWFRYSPPVIWVLAQIDFQKGDFAKAAVHLENLLHMNSTGIYDHSRGFDPDVMGAPAMMNLGICYLQTGNLERAERCFGELLNDPIHRQKALQNFATVNALRASRK